VTIIPVTRSLVVTTSPRVAPAPAAPESVETPEDSWPLLCGEVTDRSGQPVVGARVEITDLHASARTDRRGRFCLSAPPSDHTLAITAPGFAELRRPVSAREFGNQLPLVLDPAR
jgi:hypothetical protein